MKEYTKNQEWMKSLLSDLIEFDQSTKVISLENDEDGEFYVTNCPESIEGKLNNLISDDFRSVDGEAINFFKKNGYSIFPGDKDSFGWLTACIRLKNTDSIITFG